MISSEKVFDPSSWRVNADFRETEKSRPRIFNDNGEEVFVAGQWVLAGTYRQEDSTRIVVLEKPGPLPPSFDGRRAEYCRIERPWVTWSNGRTN